jgi:hypothetical protein
MLPPAKGRYSGAVVAKEAVPRNDPVNDVAVIDPDAGFIDIFPVDVHNVSAAATPLALSTNTG